MYKREAPHVFDNRHIYSRFYWERLYGGGMKSACTSLCVCVYQICMQELQVLGFVSCSGVVGVHKVCQEFEGFVA